MRALALALLLALTGCSFLASEADKLPAGTYQVSVGFAGASVTGSYTKTYDPATGTHVLKLAPSAGSTFLPQTLSIASVNS